MTERILGKDCPTKGKNDVCPYCGSVQPDYCNKDDVKTADAPKVEPKPSPVVNKTTK